MTLATLAAYTARTRPPELLHNLKKAETAEITERGAAISAVK
jgi:hypothetical protein